MRAQQPSDAIVAVTLNCNSRCTMCDIWKNDIRNEMQPDEYLALPPSLRGINVTGGEPFLRNDLPQVIKAMKTACPKARIVISTHGFLPKRIKKLIPDILAVDPGVGVRISIDGKAETHEQIRGIRGGFKRDMESLQLMKDLGVKDLGIAMTVMEQNVGELVDTYRLSEELGVEFSVTVATDSEVYFGNEKASLRPQNEAAMQDAFGSVIRSEYRSWQPKRWFRAWFEKGLLDYTMAGGRALACDAGRGFFYLDSTGNCYACHILPTLLGNLRSRSWDEIWSSAKADSVRSDIKGCQQCWMVCTIKSEARKNLGRIGIEVMAGKIAAHLHGS